MPNKEVHHMVFNLPSNIFFEPFLNNGTMFVCFRSKGTTPSFNDKLNTLASGIITICSFGGIPSTPGDILSLFFLSYHFWS